jgi:hypothetical protein
MSHNNNQDKPYGRKWQAMDIVALVVQIVLPLIALFVAWRVPSGSGAGELESDAKLSIIGLGLLVPLILNQITITIGQNRSDTSFQCVEDKLRALEEQLAQNNPMLEKAYLSKNERVLRFAIRRMDEVYTKIKFAVDNLRSNQLMPRDYYDELEYYALLIKNDKSIKGKEFRGEIWAMTSFAPDEWIKDDSYEGSWTETMRQMVDMGITTKRLCIIPAMLMDLISKDSFTEPAPEELPEFRGFVKLLTDYYGTGSRKNVAQHFIIKSTQDAELAQTGGFFAIKLTNGELHILTGETVDKLGSLTAEALFDETVIKKFREQCEKFMKPRYSLEKIISDCAQKDGFLKYLYDKGINLS